MQKLEIAAARLGVSVKTLWNWQTAGKVEFIREGNKNYVSDVDILRLTKPKEVCYAAYVCARTQEQLALYEAHILEYCTCNNISPTLIIEHGVSVDDERPKLLELLSTPGISHLVILAPDNLARIGFAYIKSCLDSNNITILEAGYPMEKVQKFKL